MLKIGETGTDLSNVQNQSPEIILAQSTVGQAPAEGQAPAGDKHLLKDKHLLCSSR